MNLDFLKSATLEKVVVERASKTGGSNLVKQPTHGDLRVFKNGRVYPSDELMEKYSLEYFPKLESVDPVTGEVKIAIIGMGVDIFSSVKWGMLKGVEQEVLFIGFIPRENNHKIDLWGSCQYEGLEPKTSVLEQGPSVFGSNSLVDYLASAYGVDWETAKYVDLKVEFEIPMKSEDDVYHLPKLVSRGDNKGKATYARRELIEIYPLTVAYTETKEVEEETDIEKAVAFEKADTVSDAMFANAEEPVKQESVEAVAEAVADSPQMENRPEEPVASQNGTASDDLLASLL